MRRQTHNGLGVGDVIPVVLQRAVAQFRSAVITQTGRIGADVQIRVVNLTRPQRDVRRRVAQHVIRERDRQTFRRHMRVKIVRRSIVSGQRDRFIII